MSLVCSDYTTKKNEVERRSAVKRSVNKNVASKVKRYIHALECTVLTPLSLRYLE
jgi:stress-induced morphogen